MRSAGWDTPGLDGVKIALGQLRSAHCQATRFTFRHAPARRARAPQHPTKRTRQPAAAVFSVTEVSDDLMEI
jgi:hypothetical protein